MAARMGRQRAGDLRISVAEDAERGKAASEAEREFLDCFEADLRNGRYGEAASLDRDAIDRRAFMYLDKARATATDAFGESSEAGHAWDRMMLASEHCGTCPGKARRYKSWSDLKAAGLPADGSDECVTNCECVVVRSDDRLGFSRAFDKEFPRLSSTGHVPQDALLPDAKLGYLTIKREKSDKSGLMASVGYTKENRDALRAEIRRMCSEYPAVPSPKASPNGTKYTVEGTMRGPDGQEHGIALQWIDDPRRGIRFMTLVPSKRKKP